MNGITPNGITKILLKGSKLSSLEQEGFEALTQGKLIPQLLERMMRDFKIEGESYLTSDVFELTQQYFALQQGAKTPFESLLIQSVIVCQCKYIQLMVQADWSKGIHEQERYLSMATRELNSMRRLMTTFQGLNGGKNFTVINTAQANLSQGPQQVNNTNQI